MTPERFAAIQSDEQLIEAINELCSARERGEIEIYPGILRKAVDILSFNQKITRALTLDTPAKYSIDNSAVYDPDVIAQLVDVIDEQIERGPITAIEKLADNTICSISKKKADYIKELAVCVNREPYISLGQLMALTNLDPHFGYYALDFGIGRRNWDTQLTSAFTTPICMEKEYRETYANICLASFECLSKQGEFSSDIPFTIINVGDGESLLSMEILDKISQSSIDPQIVKLISVDASGSLLPAQRERLAYNIEKGFKIEFFQGRVENISDFFPAHEKLKGVVIAGEELIDDLPSYFFGFDPDTGKPYEAGFNFDNPHSQVKLKLPEDLQKMFEAWLTAFPQYRTYLAAAQNATDKTSSYVPFNLRFLGVIKQIATADNFEGYWMGGDYNQFFHFIETDPYWKPVRAMGLPKEEREFFNEELFPPVSLSDSIEKPANVTTDVDPGLLSFATALGMRAEYIGRKGHFQNIFMKRDIRTISQVRSQIASTTQDLLHPFGTIDYGDIMYMNDDIFNLDQDYSGIRFNWIMSKGNVPLLLDNNNVFW